MDPNDERLKKLIHTKQGNQNVIEWMKKDWDERANVDAMYFVRTQFNQTENDFWDGQKPRDNEILGGETSKFNQIIQSKDPKKMKVLEIGCGIGRVLVSMAEIFGEVVGVDISSKMVNIARKYLKNYPNCKVYENSGSDLSLFPENYFDCCYSLLTFQHIPQKEIVSNYIKEVARVLKPTCIFRFQVHGDAKNKPKKLDTWNGVRFTSQEIHKMAEENNFEILEEKDQNDQYYWLTFKSRKD